MPRMQRLTSRDEPPSSSSTGKANEEHVTNVNSLDSHETQHTEDNFLPENNGRVHYRTYKTRFVGLAQLVLLNVIVRSTTHRL
jgi:hypothetical protein